MTLQDVKAKLIEVLQKYFKGSPDACESVRVLEQAAKELNILKDPDATRILLGAWDDLFRQGLLAWGRDLVHPDPPFFHFRDSANAFLANFSRDPHNPDGYIAHIANLNHGNSVAQSYCDEAVTVFNARCYKACAVMIGAASEALILELRDLTHAKLTSLNQTPPNQLSDWRVKTVSDKLQEIFEGRTMPRPLKERFDAHWSSLRGTIRIARNDAGHPIAPSPISSDQAHASLLMFPELVRLFVSLRDWIGSWT